MQGSYTQSQFTALKFAKKHLFFAHFLRVISGRKTAQNSQNRYLRKFEKGAKKTFDGLEKVDMCAIIVVAPGRGQGRDGYMAGIRGSFRQRSDEGVGMQTAEIEGDACRSQRRQRRQRRDQCKADIYGRDAAKNWHSERVQRTGRSQGRDRRQAHEPAPGRLPRHGGMEACPPTAI